MIATVIGLTNRVIRPGHRSGDTTRGGEDFGVVGGGHCPEPVVQVCVVPLNLGLYSGLAVTVIVVTKYRVP